MDTTSYVPLYQQLKEYIINNIVRNVWKPEDMIYSENQLFEMSSVSRSTVKKVIEDLE